MSSPHHQRSDRTARLVRLWSLLARNPRGLTASELASHCEMSVRTVYRDIIALESEIRVPVCQDGNRYSVSQSALPPIRFSLDEAMAIYISARLATRYADSRDSAVASVFRKLADVLPSPIADRVQETATELDGRPIDELFQTVFRTLTTAWSTSQRVRIGYLWTKADGSAQKVYTRLLDPYFIEPSSIGHACYVIGFDHHSKEVRTFKIERIREIKLTSEHYDIPANWNPSRYLGGAWGIVHDEEVDVAIRFSRAVAGRLREAVWHPSQRIDDEPSGSVIYTVRVAGTQEITPWILSWGPEAEVLSPPVLRDSIADLARRQAGQYAGDRP